MAAELVYWLYSFNRLYMITKMLITRICPFVLLLSCNQNTSVPSPAKTPKALQDNESEISYSRGVPNLPEELYKESVAESPPLLALEKDLDRLAVELRDSTRPFRDFDNKSQLYYSSAVVIARAIKDSLLRSRMLAVLHQSEIKYTQRTTAIKSLLDQTDKNSVAIEDYHTALKLTVSLAQMEKYQQEPEGKRELEHLADHQKKTIMQLAKFAPEH